MGPGRAVHGANDDDDDDHDDGAHVNKVVGYDDRRSKAIFPNSVAHLPVAGRPAPHVVRGERVDRIAPAACRRPEVVE